MDAQELKRLQSLVLVFAKNVNENWGNMDTEKTYDRYHEFYDMVQVASGDDKFEKYVQPIPYVAVGPLPHPLSRNNAVEILNSATQLLSYLESRLGNQATSKHLVTSLRFPIGSPYGFGEDDWKVVEERTAKKDVLYVVLGYQFKSAHYDSDNLKENIEGMFAVAANRYNNRIGHPEIKISFRPLAAGYGEHLFNEIARLIISSDIAVFEVSDLNSNVMIEMGVALTWGVQVLPIRQEGCPKPPSDISGQTWAEYTDSGRCFVDPEHGEKLTEMIKRAVRKKLGS